MSGCLVSSARGSLASLVPIPLRASRVRRAGLILGIVGVDLSPGHKSDSARSRVLRSLRWRIPLHLDMRRNRPVFVQRGRAGRRGEPNAMDVALRVRSHSRQCADGVPVDRPQVNDQSPHVGSDAGDRRARSVRPGLDFRSCVNVDAKLTSSRRPTHRSRPRLGKEGRKTQVRKLRSGLGAPARRKSRHTTH